MFLNMSWHQAAAPDSGLTTEIEWTYSGVFNALHGAGEAIRGNINSFLDQGGDAVSFFCPSRLTSPNSFLPQ